jgi:hypothetical protein
LLSRCWPLRSPQADPGRRICSPTTDEWDQLMRFGNAYDWRVMRFTSGD